MYVRLLRDYRWYWKGSILKLPDAEALDLIVSRRAIKAREGDCMRSLIGPNHDKMVRKADRDKLK